MHCYTTPFSSTNGKLLCFLAVHLYDNSVLGDNDAIIISM